MNPPNLQALQHGDSAAWDEAFVWLWPAAFGAARLVLTQGLAHESEDTAIEALEELIGKVRDLRSIEDQAAGEVRVFRIDSGRTVEKAFAVETDLSKTLELVDQYVRSKMKE
ncbi:MAG: hypothetical protein JWM99_1514 [Verrucomicrobiales bacterium]|nr:hypothetical protein [Verrucomicrobiales bacterium]